VNLWESIQVSLEGLAANKMRSALTMLGVIIGVGAVITMLSIANGAKSQMMARIQQMGTNVLIVRGGQSQSGAVRGGFGSNETLTLQDAEAIADKCPSVLRTAPEVRNNAQIKFGNMNSSTTIIGTSPDYLSVRNYKIQAGKFFTEQDVKASRKVAVIGPTAAANIFGTNFPVGQTVKINGTGFKIIGMTVTKGASGFMDEDDQIIIPVTTAMRRLFGLEYVRAISVEARSMKQMDQASAEISALMRKRHRLAQDADNDFDIRSQAEMMEFANQMSGMFTMLLGGIASVSLLVGGIGIMNIMLVSVTERTREIGIRMAIGARRGDIRRQFLVEALVLSLVGGIIGIVVGSIGAFFAARGFGWPLALSLSSIGMSFGFAAFVGIFFGYYPAVTASQLDPIDALRYE